MSRLVRGLACLALGCGIGTMPGIGLRASGPDAGAGSERPSILLAQKAAAKVKKGSAQKSGAAASAPEKGTGTDAADAGPKFSRDIAPILVGNCIRCHNPRLRRGKFDLTTFEKLMAGSDVEKVIEPGKPDESHLVLRIRGDETPKMPQGNNNNLADEAIAKITQWVKAGARLDAGIDPRATLDSYAPTAEQLRIAELKKLPAEERDRRVEEVGLKRWKQASPKTTPEVTPGTHFLLFSNLPRDRANALLKGMETAYTQLRSILSAPNAPALDWPEKTSLFVFNDAAGFIEFVRSIENREVESNTVGTASFGVKEPFVAVVDPLGGREDPTLAPSGRKLPKTRRAGEEDPGASERSVDGLLAEQMAIGVLKHEGNAPDWLTMGVGTYFAAGLDPRSDYVRQLRKDAAELLRQGWTSRANDGLGGALRPEGVRAVGHAIVDWMTHDPQARPRFPRFVRAMLEPEAKLDDVIQDVFNGRRQDLLAYSGEWVATHYGRLR